jgi:hypothetical protein
LIAANDLIKWPSSGEAIFFTSRCYARGVDVTFNATAWKPRNSQ